MFRSSDLQFPLSTVIADTRNLFGWFMQVPLREGFPLPPDYDREMMGDPIWMDSLNTSDMVINGLGDITIYTTGWPERALKLRIEVNTGTLGTSLVIEYRSILCMP